MRAAIIFHDKILRSIIISILHQNLNENQFGGRIGLDTTLQEFYTTIKQKKYI